MAANVDEYPPVTGTAVHRPPTSPRTRSGCGARAQRPGGAVPTGPVRRRARLYPPRRESAPRSRTLTWGRRSSLKPRHRLRPGRTPRSLRIASLRAQALDRSARPCSWASRVGLSSGATSARHLLDVGPRRRALDARRARPGGRSARARPRGRRPPAGRADRRTPGTGCAPRRRAVPTRGRRGGRAQQHPPGDELGPVVGADQGGDPVRARRRRGVRGARRRRRARTT